MKNKLDFKGWTLAEMPQEVKEALVIGYIGQPVGTELYNKIMATVEKYPQYFSSKPKAPTKEFSKPKPPPQEK
jgi:hypothetical protein